MAGQPVMMKVCELKIYGTAGRIVDRFRRMHCHAYLSQTAVVDLTQSSTR